MKKRLLLVRHGKSDWNDAALADIDRHLKNRGVRDSFLMGKMLRERDLLPELILSSPANRAIHTAIILCRGLQVSPATIQISDDLYLASPEVILSAIYSLPDNLHTLIIVGHNPGMTQLADQLAPEAVHNLPTAGIAHFIFNTETWSSISSVIPADFFTWQPQKGKTNK